MFSPYNKIPFFRVPSDQFEHIKKGIYCTACHTFSLTLMGRKLVCQCCRSEETVGPGMLRATKAFNEFFPERRITVQAMSKWCGLEVNNRNRLAWITIFKPNKDPHWNTLGR